MRLDALHCPVSDVPVFAGELVKSIEQGGLANPVIVVRGPREDLITQLGEINGDPSGLPKEPVLNVVYGGANRVTAARELGYDHIDCVLLPSFELALRVQAIQREGYDGTTATAVGSA